jgi:hypothetical protein
MRQYSGAVTAVRNIFTPLRLFIQTSPNNLAVASGHGNRFFTQKPLMEPHLHQSLKKISYLKVKIQLFPSRRRARLTKQIREKGESGHQARTDI